MYPLLPAKKVNKRIPVSRRNRIKLHTHPRYDLSKRGRGRPERTAFCLVTPYYNKCNTERLESTLSKPLRLSVNIPIILYNIPGRTGVKIAPETVVELCKTVDNIVGVKDATGDLSEVADVLSMAGGSVDLYSGNDDQIIPVLSLGGKGVISVLSNILPQETHDMTAAFFAGDTKKAMDMQLGYLDLIHALFSEVNPIPVKKAMNLMGMEVGPLRMPLTEMEEAHAKVLADEMKKAGIEVK